MLWCPFYLAHPPLIRKDGYDPLHVLLFLISSKDAFIYTTPDRIAHTTAFVTPVVEHWLEIEIAQWVHHYKFFYRVSIDGIIFMRYFRRQPTVWQKLDASLRCHWNKLIPIADNVSISNKTNTNSVSIYPHSIPL